jgi:hypothetical protein
MAVTPPKGISFVLMVVTNCAAISHALLERKCLAPIAIIQMSLERHSNPNAIMRQHVDQRNSGESVCPVLCEMADPQHIGPQLLVAERIVAKDGLSISFPFIIASPVPFAVVSRTTRELVCGYCGTEPPNRGHQRESEHD